MQEQIEKDLKSALLGGDKTKVETLRGLKNSLQYAAIEQGVKDGPLADEQVQKVLAKESKKRREAADLYKQGGNNQRAEQELAEKAIIDAYLPKQVDEVALEAAVDEEISKLATATASDMGKIIGTVRGKLGAGADGAVIARIVKQKLEQE